MQNIPFPLLMAWKEILEYTRFEDYEIENDPFHWLHFANEVSTHTQRTDILLSCLFHDVGRIKSLKLEGHESRRMSIIRRHSFVRYNEEYASHIESICQKIEDDQDIVGVIHSQVVGKTPTKKIQEYMEIHNV